MIPPARIADNRTDEWQSKEEFFAYIRPKKVFSGISDEVLMDYVNYVSRIDQDGTVRLGYPKTHEAKVYAAMQDPWQVLPRIVHPTLAIRGKSTDIISRYSWRKWKSLQPSASFKTLEGGHLLPFEYPELVGEEVLKHLRVH